MTSQRETTPFVRIQIASSSPDKPKEIRLTRLQFEVLFLMIPVVLLWGLASTAILIKTLYIDRAQLSSAPLSRSRQQPDLDVSAQKIKLPANLNSNGSDHAGGAIEDSDSASPAVDLKNEALKSPPTNKPAKALAATLNSASRSFKVDEIFNVDVSITGPSLGGPFAVTIAMTNLTGDIDSGRYWLSVLAETTEGEKIWLTPMPWVRIDSEGQAKSPTLGPKYSFKNFRSQKLTISAPGAEIARFETVMVGFERHGKTPAIAKARLIAR